MNDEVYIKHQYDALTKNATPLGLLGLAEQITDFARPKLARMFVRIFYDKNGRRILLGLLLLHTSAHEKGKPVEKILESVLKPDVLKPDAVIKDLKIYTANIEAVIDTGPENIDRWRVDPDQDVWRPVNPSEPAKAGKHYDITVTIGGDPDTSRLDCVVVEVRILGPSSQKIPYQTFTQYLKDGEVLGNALNDAINEVNRGMLLIAAKPVKVINTWVENASAKTNANLATHVIVGHYYKITAEIV